MRYIIVILLAVLAFETSAQTATPAKVDLTAGDYLIKAKKRAYTGLSLTLAGSLFASLGATNPDLAAPMAAVGGSIALIGVFVNLSSWAQIGKAGEQLNMAIGPMGASVKFTL